MPLATTGELDAARLLLDRLGVVPEQLLNDDRSMPTFGEYVPQVAAAVSAGTRRVYGSYWDRICEQWGTRRLDEPTATEIGQFAQQAKADVVVRANARGGHLAAEHTIAAMRCIYRHAIADGYLPEGRNFAIRVPKPRRQASARRALLGTQLAAISTAASTTGNDRDLDGLIIRLHVETACRRGGALSLRPADLDPSQCLARLREKGGTDRWQPISPTLMRHLRLHHEQRGGTQGQAPLLCYRNGKPITYRRYDHLWARIGRHLPWVAAQQISTHWLRHTTLTWVERHFGYAVAHAYAGHHSRNDFGATATYTRADVYEVAAALAALTGESHPLA
ncbi:tyrosine-type recombinase/integrase [Couchioplanes azureus]|uniref:tyrosine-type recombinase/integrase n=1 Tax=Couchioplanes caeruleus TaxID=56438 RepID=UPI00166F8874|nr:site-specific integrase [Couchioplanes caeruleus]